MKRVCGLVVLICLLVCSAFADGGGKWVNSRYNGYIQLASHVGDYDGWVDISGLGGVALGEQISVRVISRNASVWAEPRTNSKKLGTVKNGELLMGIHPAEYGGLRIVEQNGFYAVSYNGTGWINSAYVVHAPFEIVLMESNVPAYCAPDSTSKCVGSLSKLTRYTVLGFYEDFYVVNLREAAAYIPMSVKHYDTTFERLYHGGMSGTVTVQQKTALRTGPGSDYASVREIRAGQTFTCVDEIDGWYLVWDDDSGCYTYIWTGDAWFEW